MPQTNNVIKFRNKKNINPFKKHIDEVKNMTIYDYYPKIIPRYNIGPEYNYLTFLKDNMSKFNEIYPIINKIFAKSWKKIYNRNKKRKREKNNIKYKKSKKKKNNSIIILKIPKN